MESGQQDQYELFISYARKDDQPLGGGDGWITQMRDCILRNHRRYSTEPLRIFFDTSAIRDMDDWGSRIVRGLRESRVLLACLSPNYLASRYCREEWHEYRNRLVHGSAGSDTIAVVRLSDPGSVAAADAAWLEQIRAIQQTDLSEWFPGEAPRTSDEIQRRIAVLGESLWARIQRARQSAAAPGNLRRPNPHFVGRVEQLEALHAKLSAAARGVVVVLNGLGGLGKTELALAYAQGWAYAYPAGVWMLRAEGKNDLLAVLGGLAYAPEMRLEIPESQQGDPAQLGRAVLAELARRAEQADEKRRRESPTDPRYMEGAAAALIILDNVDRAALLSASQLVELNGRKRVRILATTRLGRPQLGSDRRFLDFLPVDSLDVETGVALIREHQPPRDAEGWRPDFASKSEESSARALVRELDGFTLAIEQVAVYLGLNPSVKPSAFLKGLRERGLVRTDEVVGSLQRAGREGDILHSEKLLRIVMAATLDRLGPGAPAVVAGQGNVFQAIQQERKRAPARTVLEFAARFAPDMVPWPWLRDLTVRFHPDLAVHAEDEPDPWDDIRRQLEGLRLLVQTSVPEHARMHRMIVAHLRAPVANADLITTVLAGSLDVLLRDFLVSRIEALRSSTHAPPPWEIDALIQNLPPILNAGCEQRVAKGLAPLAVLTRQFAAKAATYRGAAAAVPLLDAAAKVAQKYAEQSAQLPHTNPIALDTTFQHAMSYAQRGELAANEGDNGRAQELIDRACAMLEQLVAEVPGDENWQRQLSVTYEKQGDLARSRRALDEAASKYAAALEISRLIASAHPHGVTQQNELAESILKMGQLAQDQGRFDDARRHFEEALRIRRWLLESGRRNPDVEHGVCVVLNALARLSLKEGRTDGVAEYINECLKRGSGLADADPGNLDLKESLSFYFLLASDYSQAIEDINGAYAARNLARGLIVEISHRDPGNARARKRMLDVSVEIGDLAVKLGDVSAARQYFKHAIEIAMTLAARDGVSADKISTIGEKLEALGRGE
jgi:tetratricopeptide (TPR) repeat protein